MTLQAFVFCHSIEDIKKMISKEMTSRGDNLVAFGDDVKFLYFRYAAENSLMS